MVGVRNVYAFSASVSHITALSACVVVFTVRYALTPKEESNISGYNSTIVIQHNKTIVCINNTQRECKVVPSKTMLFCFLQ